MSAYYVFAINKSENKIEELKVGENENIENSKTWIREKVIAAIENGNIFKTYPKNSSESADIIVYSVKNTKYLKTEANETEEDNLGNLPQF